MVKSGVDIKILTIHPFNSVQTNCSLKTHIQKKKEGNSEIHFTKNIYRILNQIP